MPKEFSRLDRINERIARELARIIQFEVKDPRVKMVTISAVKVSRDLSHAKVYVSAVGTEEQAREIVEVLVKASGFLRSKIASAVQLRTTPKLNFVYDESLIRSNRIVNLIDSQLKSENDEPESE